MKAADQKPMRTHSKMVREKWRMALWARVRVWDCGELWLRKVGRLAGMVRSAAETGGGGVSCDCGGFADGVGWVVVVV